MTSHTYHVPISVIIEMMREEHETLAWRASLPVLPSLAPGMCRADIVVGKQGVQVCTIIEQRTGHVLRQDGEALSIVQQCGLLAWILLPQQRSPRHERSPHPRVVSSSEEAGKVPWRTAICTPDQMQAWSHQRKRVFLLVNGSNTVEHIAHILTQSPHDVSQVLFELRKHQMIDL